MRIVRRAKLPYNESSVRKLNICDPIKVKNRGEAITNTPNMCAHNISEVILPISNSSIYSEIELLKIMIKMCNQLNIKLCYLVRWVLLDIVLLLICLTFFVFCIIWAIWRLWSLPNRKGFYEYTCNYQNQRSHI